MRHPLARRFGAAWLPITALCGLLLWSSSSLADPRRGDRPQLPYSLEGAKEPLWSRVKFSVTFGVFRAAIHAAEKGARVGAKLEPVVAGAKRAVRTVFPRWDAMKESVARPVRTLVGESALRLAIGIDRTCEAGNTLREITRSDVFPTRNDVVLLPAR